MLWTAFASVFSLLLGYSRVPYAAALEGDYFKVFARVHPKHHFPHVSLLWLGGAAIVFCLFKLADVVTALVVIRIIGAVPGADDRHHRAARRRRPDLPRPFRMWLYPVPAILAFLGFVYVIVMRPKSIESIRTRGARRAGRDRAVLHQAPLLTKGGTVSDVTWLRLSSVQSAPRLATTAPAWNCPMQPGISSRHRQPHRGRRDGSRGSDCSRGSGGRGWSGARYRDRVPSRSRATCR